MRRFRSCDWRFALLVLAHVIGIAGFLGAGDDSTASTRGSWRAIDTTAVRAKIRAGDLSSHEADWYRGVPDRDVRAP